ncbi:MAG: hypothetical protein ACREQP_23565 [Candidatus Binatia bacterium]
MRRAIVGLLLLSLLSPSFAQSQDIKAWQLKTAQFKEWLELVKGDTYKFWTRLDGTRRPHKLYVGEGFNKAALKDQEEFVEIFSHYLAGHPEKFMLIDLYDAGSGLPIGEFGWGGFKLFVNGTSQAAQDKPSTAIADSADGAPAAKAAASAK